MKVLILAKRGSRMIGEPKPPEKQPSIKPNRPKVIRGRWVRSVDTNKKTV